MKSSLILPFVRLLSSPQGNTWLRRLRIAAAVLVLVWLALWLAVPPLVHSRAQQALSDLLGRQVSIGRLQFLPWSLELTLQDLSVAGRDGSEEPQLKVARIHADLELQSLLRRAPVIDALEVDAPILRITQLAPGQTDLDDVVHRLTQPGPEGAQPLGFALYNIALQGGALDFVDRTVGQTHEVRDIAFSLPFLSNLSAQRAVKVQPRLALRIGSSMFDSAAEAMPFVESHRTDAVLRFQGLDLAPYKNYLPAGLPLALTSGTLNADLRIAFEQRPQPVVQISGRLGLDKLRLQDGRQREWLSLEALQLQVADFQPLQRVLRVDSVELTAPQAHLRRNAAGQWDWGAQAAAAARKPAPGKAQQGAAPAGGWTLSLGRFATHGGSLQWEDESVPGGARLAVRNLVLQASALSLPAAAPMQWAGSLALAPLEGSSPQNPAQAGAPATLAFAGAGTVQQGRVALSLRSLPLEWGAPYLGAWFTPRLSGALETDAGLAWNGDTWVARVARLGLDGVGLACVVAADCSEAETVRSALRDRRTLADLQRLELEDVRIDGARRAVRIGRMALAQPRVRVERDARGQWMVDRWLRAAQAGPPPEPAAAAPAAKPWSLVLGSLELDGGVALLNDAALSERVTVAATDMRVRLQDFAPTTPGARPAGLNLSVRLGAGQADPGRLEVEGSLGVTPLQVQGRVVARHLPLQALAPYVQGGLRARIGRADGSFMGQVQVRQTEPGLQWAVQGDAALDDVRVRLAAPAGAEEGQETLALQAQQGEDVLQWRSLGLRGIDAAQPAGGALALSVRESALSDFFARIVVQPDGRLNLQDLLGPVSPAPEGPTAAAAVQAPQAPQAPQIRLGPISLTQGRVHFTDHFVRPQYSAQLSGLTGRLGAIASVPAEGGAEPAMAELELRGKAEGTASLEILGKLNPLATPVALDVQGRMQGLELSPLTPYAIKYAGHGIERGKLNMEVSYRVQPDGQLTAQNKLVLHQLVFGDEVPDAPRSLPVRLAVALLADRNGVIDVDLPVSGSLNDPEFRVGSVVFKLLGNLILKAVTAPFSLLAGVGEGGAEQGVVAFAEGSAALDTAARASLDKVVQTLEQRPALNMTVVGQASLQAEREAWKRAQLQQVLLAHKRRTAPGGAAAGAEPEAQISAEEYPAMLKEVYRRADIPKPRNLVGLAKDLPDSEMQALLLANIAVPDTAMHDLALARAVAVRDYLLERRMPPERLFLGAVRLSSGQDGWTPRAELGLGVR